jgi:hypothetical protein
MEFVCPYAHTRAKFSKNGLLRAIGTLFFVLFVVTAFSVVSPPNACAGQATLSWNGASSTGVKGYKIYYGTASGSYSQSADAGNTTTCTINNLVDGQTYYFVASAYDSSGNQSIYSNEVSKTVTSTQSSYTITASAGTGGSISPSGSVTVNSAGSEAYTITPASGYQISSVTVDGSSVGAVSSYTFSNVTANHTISAAFAASPPSSGTGTSSSTTSSSVWQNQSFSSQSGVFTASFDMIPNAANIDGLTVLSAVPTQSFADGAAMVRFNTAGSIDARNGSSYTADVAVPYTAGSTYHVRMVVNVPNKVYDIYVTPQGGNEIHLASGYAFRTEQSTVSALNNLGVFADAGSHQVSNFAIAAQAQTASYYISASAGTGGGISPSGFVSVSSGTSKGFVITPDNGYQITDVTVDGTSVGAVSSYTFSNVTANHTISATFTATSSSTSSGTSGKSNHRKH